jgi:multidrug efflux pump subunit AcrA (membrane-fusion protein)
MPGMFARVRIMLYSKKDALVVPTDAIQGGEGEKFVYALKLPESAGAGDAVEPKVAGAMGGGLGAIAALTKKQDKGDKASGKESTETAKIEEGTAEKRPVTVGYTRTDYSQIDAGLTEGEIVAMTGFERLEDGKKIRLIETQEAEM